MQQKSYHTAIIKEGDTFFAEFPHISDFNNITEIELKEMILSLKNWAIEHDICPRKTKFKLKIGNDLMPIILH